ncbi:MAG: Fic family protein [Acidimicrobiales bacterium]
MDHSHGPEAAMSDEADALYRPLGGLEPWAAAPVDEAAWDDALDRLRILRADHPDWSDMVTRGAVLAAAHQSGALDGMHRGDRDVTMALVRGEVSPASLDEATRAHVRANADALYLSRDVDVTEDSIRRTHEVACGPQLTHRVRVENRVQDHVLAAGDCKHHPNHVRTEAGNWLATAPVAQVPAEMATLVEAARSAAFAALHPVTRAAYLHHALLHVQPFADGNGRVARALAGGSLLRAASVPLLVFADDAASYHDAHSPAALVDLIGRAAAGLVDMLVASDHHGEALDRWRERSQAADALLRRLVPAVEEALRRHHDRPPRARRADLSGAAVTWSEAVVIRVPIGPGRTVEEVLTVDVEPAESDGPVSVTAAEAGLRLGATPVDGWLDRVVSTLALRVAAELED